MAALGDLEMSMKSSVAAKMQHKKERNNTEGKKSVLVTLYSDSLTRLGPACRIP